MQRNGFIALAVGCGLFFIFTTLYFVSKYNLHNREVFLSHLEEEQHFQEAEDLIACGRIEEALSIISYYKDEIELDGPTSRQWADLLITACLTIDDQEQLLILYEYMPEVFIGHEDAVFSVAHHYLNNGLFQDYQILRNYWRGYEVDEEAWFSLDVEKLLAEGKKAEAIHFLNSRTFGKDTDVNRLLKLAELTMKEEPQESWNYLTKATKKDPINANIRILRAQLLESLGDNEAALSEYRGALKLDSTNAELKEYLGDFLIAQQNFVGALEHWSYDLNEKTDDSTWLKFLFWKQVAKPIQASLADLPKPNTVTQTYIHYLLSLQPGEFWKNDAFNKLLYARELLKTEQSSYWLKLIATLKHNKLREAWHLLENNTFADNSWNPELENALKNLFIYRGLGIEQVNQEVIPFALLNLENPNDYYSLLATLAKHAQPGYPTIETTDELDTFLHSKDAIATIFLKAGWTEAARALYPYHAPSEHTPEWITLDFITALSDNLSVTKAIEYTATLEESPHLSDLTIQLLEKALQSEQEIFTLYKHAHQTSDSGFKLAQCLTKTYLDNDYYSEAKKVITNNKRLCNTTEGKEMLARIALADGDIAAAEKLYLSIETSSIEAKSYLARKAFSEKDWERAKDLTEELLREFPENSILQQNMRSLAAFLN